jgi:dephospho-CoA kinase
MSASSSSAGKSPLLKVGLTGGIASGKSAVAEAFAKLGATVIDTDLIAREVVAVGEPGLDAVRKLFGPDVLTAEGELNRRALRESVFADPVKRRQLEEILHPLIHERTLLALAQVTGPYVIVVVPLLVETSFGALVDRVLVVDVPVETQLARLMRRDGLARDAAAAMINAQVDRARRLAAADDVIDNSGGPEATRQQVARLHQRYLELRR